MLLNASQSQLVLVDYQARLMPAIQDAESVLKNARLLARMAELTGVPTIGTEQRPEKLGPNPDELRGQRTLIKSHFSAVPDGLADWLRSPVATASSGTNASPATARNTIVIAGCEAHVCLLQTALDLIAEAFSLWVVCDACGSRTERNRDAAFARLARAGATLVTAEMVGFEWLRSADHAAFREFQALIR